MKIKVEDLKMFDWKDKYIRSTEDTARQLPEHSTSKDSILEIVQMLHKKAEELTAVKIETQKARDFLEYHYGVPQQLSEMIKVNDIVSYIGMPAVVCNGDIIHLRRYHKGTTYERVLSGHNYVLLLRAEDILKKPRWSTSDDQYSFHHNIRVYNVYILLDGVADVDLPKTEVKKLSDFASKTGAEFIFIMKDFRYTRLSHFASLFAIDSWQTKLNMFPIVIDNECNYVHVTMDPTVSTQARKAVDRIDKWMDRLADEEYLSVDQANLFTNMLLAYFCLEQKQHEWFKAITIDHITKHLDLLFEKRDFPMKKNVYDVVNQIKYGNLVDELTK